MLILGRKPGQEIIIRDPQGNPLVTLAVVRFSQGRVQLGITAPDNHAILRAELQDGWVDHLPPADDSTSP